MAWYSRATELGAEGRDRLVHFLRTHSRFLTPLLLVFFAKLIGCAFLYHLLRNDVFQTYWMTVDWGTEVQNEVLLSAVDDGVKWTYLFLGWDSSWYLSIAQKGYTFSDQSYAFFPGLPVLSVIVNFFIDHPFSAFVISSFIVGILWVPLYQAIAEIYLDRETALKSTLLYAFFPYVFFFTTVGYAEGLFLFSTLGAWYFYNKGKMVHSMIFASLATISRPPGLLILLPILIETVKTVKRSEIVLSFKRGVSIMLPFFSLFIWLLYCRVTAYNWFAPFTRSAWNSMYSIASFFLRAPSPGGVSPLYTMFSEYGVFSVAWLAFLLVVPLLVYGVSRIDKSLGVYSGVYLAGIIFFGAVESIPRFLSFLFPLWLPLAVKFPKNKWSNIILILIFLVFYGIGLLLWLAFLKGAFIS